MEGSMQVILAYTGLGLRRSENDTIFFNFDFNIFMVNKLQLLFTKNCDGLVNDLIYGIFNVPAITTIIPMMMIAAVTKIMGMFSFTANIIIGGMMDAELGGIIKAW